MAAKQLEAKKLSAILEAIASIEKTYGKGTVMRLGDKPTTKISVISTGVYSIDSALGIGGFPRGRICEVYGPESSGKTTLALHLIAEAQKNGGAAAFIDVEHALDLNYAAAIGVNIKDLFVCQPDYGEQALEVAETLTATNAFDIIVIDSVAALVPRAEIEGDMGDAQMALQARLMSQACRKLTPVVATSKTLLLFINQIRSAMIAFGNPEVTAGGNALKFYASIRLDVRRQAPEKDEKGAIIGNRTKIKIVKNKCAPPFKEVFVFMTHGFGIDAQEDIMTIAEGMNLFVKSGSWITYKENRYQGRRQLLAKLKEDPEMYAQMYKEVMDRAVFDKLPTIAQVAPTAEELSDSEEGGMEDVVNALKEVAPK